MKRYILSILVCAFAAVACINDNIDDYGPCRGAVLQLSITDSETRANGDGASLGTNDDLFNEDAINKVDIFLYPTGATSSNAVWHETISLSDTRETASLAPQVDNNVLESLGLANDGDGCVAYIVVNGPDAVSNATTTDVESLKAVMLTTASFGKVAEYDTGKPAPSSTDNTTVKLMSVAPQDDFVMDSEVVALTYSKSNNRVTTADSNPIYVRRAAAKIRLTLSVADEIVIDGETWTPQVDAMSLAFYNGVNKGRVGGYSDATVEDAPEGSFFGVSGVDFDYQGVMSDITQPGTSAVTRAAVSNVTHVVPFYSYPSDWDVDLAEEDAAYFQVVVPWGVTTDKDGNWIEDEDINYISYRYNVPINMLTKQLERNKFYNIVLNIGVLGNLDFIDETSHSFYVTEWNNQAIDITLNRPLYLTVEKNYVEVYNQDTFGVAYKASDAISAVITKVVKPNYTAELAKEDNAVYESSVGATSVTPPQFTVGNSRFGNTNPISVSVVDGQIVLTHVLNNDMSSNDFDYVPYTITVLVTMKLADGKTITEEVVFKQYPALYVFADQNAAFKGTNYSDNDNNNPDNLFVNGWSRNTSSSWFNRDFAPGVTNSPSQLGTVNGYTSSSNHNPNQYVITVSSISSDLPYVISDSRSRTSDVTGLGIGTIANSYAVDYDFNLAAAKRQLQYYYRTIEDLKSNSSDKTNPDSYVTGWNVAPKFRIASSYSVTSNFENDIKIARSRCATYQENGYPAGRWRMPTYAEIALIASLSERSMIPRLFSDDTAYWCAHGRFVPEGSKVTLGTTSKAANSIRCVYDEWFWGSERLSIDTNVTPNFSQFVWGDMKIW